jgi:hypothetical protein
MAVQPRACRLPRTSEPVGALSLSPRSAGVFDPGYSTSSLLANVPGRPNLWYRARLLHDPHPSTKSIRRCIAAAASGGPPTGTRCGQWHGHNGELPCLQIGPGFLVGCPPTTPQKQGVGAPHDADLLTRHRPSTRGDESLLRSICTPHDMLDESGYPAVDLPGPACIHDFDVVWKTALVRRVCTGSLRSVELVGRRPIINAAAGCMATAPRTAPRVRGSTRPRYSDVAHPASRCCTGRLCGLLGMPRDS